MAKKKDKSSCVLDDTTVSVGDTLCFKSDDRRYEAVPAKVAMIGRDYCTLSNDVRIRYRDDDWRRVQGGTVWLTEQEYTTSAYSKQLLNKLVEAIREIAAPNYPLVMHPDAVVAAATALELSVSDDLRS